MELNSIEHIHCSFHRLLLLWPRFVQDLIFFIELSDILMSWQMLSIQFTGDCVSRIYLRYILKGFNIIRCRADGSTQYTI